MLSIENDCLYYGNRVIIPEILKYDILKLLHETHVGTSRMKLLAQSFVWWLNIDKNIEEFANSCEPCQLMQSTPSPVKLSPWRETKFFFERIHIDFFYFRKTDFLIVVDTFSRWFDVKILPNKTYAQVKKALSAIFIYFGLPYTLVADNGPPFNSSKFKEFCKQNAIIYLNSPPYHPQSNGWAERGVRTVKTCLKKMMIDTKTQTLPLSEKVDNFLLKYRNTPVSTTKETPNSKIFIFRPRTLMSALNEKASLTPHKPPTTPNNQQPAHVIDKPIKTYEPNELVLYKNEFKTEVKWIKAKIQKKLSKCRYTIELTGRGVRKENVHGDQLRPFNQANTLTVTPIPKSVAENKQTPTTLDEENTSAYFDTAQSPDISDIEDNSNDSSPIIISSNDSSPDGPSNSILTSDTDSPVPRNLRAKPSVNYRETRLRKKQSRAAKKGSTLMLDVTM